MRALVLLALAGLSGCTPQLPDLQEVVVSAGQDPMPEDPRTTTLTVDAVQSEDGSQVAYVRETHRMVDNALLAREVWIRTVNGGPDQLAFQLIDPSLELRYFLSGPGYTVLRGNQGFVLERVGGDARLISAPTLQGVDCGPANVIPSPDGLRLAAVAGCSDAFEVTMFDVAAAPIGFLRLPVAGAQVTPEALWRPDRTLVVEAAGHSFQVDDVAAGAVPTAAPACFDPPTASCPFGGGHSYLDCQ